MSAPPPGETDNLTTLENLNEETLLNELKVRIGRDVVYTYVGEILVAVNPYKEIAGLYAKDKQDQYTGLSDRSQFPPHIFCTADQAFTSMVFNPPGPAANQVCVISGESGAGKTESAKLFMKQIIKLSTTGVGNSDAASSRSLEEKIVDLNPLLEAFGNAQTLMNDNSSRFGKFVELRFNENLQIEGATMNEYLLEKSRVIYQSPGEQNFHVFYLLFASLDSSRKEKFMIDDPRAHRFVKSNEEALKKISSDRIKDMSKELFQCMELVGFSSEEIDNLFSLLVGVLYSGDIEFDGEDQARIVSDSSVINKLCAQLDIQEVGLIDALTKSVNVTRGEMIERPYKLYEAEDCRDAMAKALYGRAFTWIVQKVNKLLGPKNPKPGPKDKTIGILDIFGFEQFDHNSFEQLLINLANEQLQFFFNNHIFKMELDEYAREGIDGSKIKFEDNQPLLDMLLSKPLGLLSICDEEALFPKGTDQSMIEKFHQNLGANKGYEKPRGNEKIFSIHHYAGRVTYQGVGFLEKNRDTLAFDVIGAMRLSGNSLVASLFGADEEDKNDAKGAKVKKDKADFKKSMRKSMKKAAKAQEKTKKTTVGAEFKISLANLMTEMQRAAPHFIRCVKPTLKKKPGIFEDELVLKQLRYTGMLETTRIRKEGYSHRPTFADFVERYKGIGYPFTAKPAPTLATCEKILAKAAITGWQVGKTKVFLRYFHADMLADKMRPFAKAAIPMQKVSKLYIAKRRVAKLKDVAAKQAKLADDLLSKIARNSNENFTVQSSLVEEDNKRPSDYWTVKAAEPVVDKKLKKYADEAKKGGKFSRQASVRWFKEVEMKKGAGMKAGAQAGALGSFEAWFHGVISRAEAEELLQGNEPGTFLIRVAESRFGYSLSFCVEKTGRVRHLMIDQTPGGKYILVGNDKTFPGLNELVTYFSSCAVVNGVSLKNPCGQRDGVDDTVEFLDKKGQAAAKKAGIKVEG